MQHNEIKGRYHTLPMPSSKELEVLVISFDGVFRHGAQGNKDAYHMIGIIRAGLAASRNHGHEQTD